ncbi:MAG TPA: GNAT family N-acetyltransferase [Pyrinomonadaceae bacterium]|jgi:GNAT superfamily N-acetyltransferase|nr:GNAT family N-acetyltransferase [Pyrinomonadaceae bacterium]
MLEVRRAGLEDGESVREVYDAAAEEGATFDEEYLRRLIREGGVLVAEEVGEVVGFGSIEVSAAEQVRWLYVVPGRRGSGVGSEILRRLESVGREAGLESIRLHAALGAVGFYRRNGYREAAQGEEVGHDHDGAEMLKELRLVSTDG